MIPARFPVRWIAAVPLALSAGSFAQVPANSEPIILPEFNVHGERDLPPPETWFYARIEGFEVLSNASAARTRALATELQRYAYALNLVWPVARPTGAGTAALVICGADRKFDTFLPASLQETERTFTAYSQRGREFSLLLLDEQTRSLNLALVDVATTTAAPAASESGGAAEPTGTEAGVDSGFQVDPQQQLNRQYVHYLLSGLTPRPAPWLAEGLAQLCASLRITETEISLGRVEDPNAVAAGRTDRDFNAALATRALMPMAALFAVERDSPTAAGPLDNRWAKQCHAFVHWGLYGDLGRNQKAFLRFLVRSEREGVSEGLFRECFQQDYGQMLFTLRAHIEQTRSKVGGVRAAPGETIPWPPAVDVRPATATEIARLQADAYALTGHPGRGRDALILAFRRGERDAALLAALGTAELHAGERGRARKLLEAAAAAKTSRPRAYLCLAALRLDERLAHPHEPGGRISYEQLLGVLEPLLAARQLTPRLPDTYELLATAWSHCATPPPAPHLALIDEGLQLFPQNATLRAARATLAPP